MQTADYRTAERHPSMVEAQDGPLKGLWVDKADFDALAAECDRYRQALERVRDFLTNEGTCPDDGYLDAQDMQAVAREALNG